MERGVDHAAMFKVVSASTMNKTTTLQNQVETRFTRIRKTHYVMYKGVLALQSLTHVIA